MVQNGDEDLSDKSVYMNGVKTMRALSEQRWEDPCLGGRWSWPGFQDVGIIVVPSQGLQVKHAMWGIMETIGHV